jgi:hypothetical protein
LLSLFSLVFTSGGELTPFWSPFDPLFGLK